MLQSFRLVEKTLKDALLFVTNLYAGAVPWNDYGIAYGERKRQKVLDKLGELLWPYEQGLPLNYNRSTAERKMPWIIGGTPQLEQVSYKDSMQEVVELTQNIGVHAA